MAHSDSANKIITSRYLHRSANKTSRPRDIAEGGCGFIGMACSERIPARHLLKSLFQMRNRGNGKGGGIAAVGLTPSEFGVNQEVLETNYLLAVAYIESTCRPDLEQKHIIPKFIIDQASSQPHIPNYRKIEGLDIPPPEVIRYFVRPNPESLDAFKVQRNLEEVDDGTAADEFVHQTTRSLNNEFYNSTSVKKAFILSNGKNLLALKMVGYADDVLRYYQIEDLHAHVWIGHHSYPSKMLVSDPGGANPFVGLNKVLFHSGSFANSSSINEYLSQFNIHPLFLTDSEISVQLFDLLHCSFNYPLEYVIEILAPTIEYDFTMLPSQKQYVYKMLRTNHPHASPDGPWIFLIGQSDSRNFASRLIAITDTGMLQPQVFALQEGVGVSIGFVATEKHAIDATLRSLAGEDTRFWSRADRYWSTRGGSSTDGGAFIFTVQPEPDGSKQLTCVDKFGCSVGVSGVGLTGIDQIVGTIRNEIPNLTGDSLFQWAVNQIPSWTYSDIYRLFAYIEGLAYYPEHRSGAILALTLLIDRQYPIGNKRHSKLLALYDDCFAKIVQIIQEAPCRNYNYHAFGSPLPTCNCESQTVIVDAHNFPREGIDSVSMCLKRLYSTGFNRFIVINTSGHRFLANGLGPDTKGMRIDVFGSPGDYLGSGIDGLEIYVHNNGQDQIGQIMKSGKLVVYGDVGQTFMYCAKGGEAYVLGNTASRPLSNAVGQPRVVINGTALDYLATSFMACDPLNDGGFVVLNGIHFDDEGKVIELETPFAGCNLFTLSSGGALYIRDPRCVLSEAQLNGAEFVPLTVADWALVRPHLEENERLFDIKVIELLKCDGASLPPENVYRKIKPYTTNYR